MSTSPSQGRKNKCLGRGGEDPSPLEKYVRVQGKDFLVLMTILGR